MIKRHLYSQRSRFELPSDSRYFLYFWVQPKRGLVQRYPFNFPHTIANNWTTTSMIVGASILTHRVHSKYERWYMKRYMRVGNSGTQSIRGHRSAHRQNTIIILCILVRSKRQSWSIPSHWFWFPLIVQRPRLLKSVFKCEQINSVVITIAGSRPASAPVVPHCCWYWVKICLQNLINCPSE